MTSPVPGLAQVRLLTGLTVDELTDDDVLTLLDINGDVPKLAAADALEAYASGLLDVQSDDITLSGSKRATLLMARAARLREQAAAEDEGGFFFDVVGGAQVRPELTERPSW